MWTSSSRRQRKNNKNNSNHYNSNKNRNNRSKSNRTNNGQPLQGTESNALIQIERNSRHFKYPQEGFVNKIEYTLLYNMISSPNVYPHSVIINEITNSGNSEDNDETTDFLQYIYVNTKKTTTTTTNNNNNNNKSSLSSQHSSMSSSTSAVSSYSDYDNNDYNDNNGNNGETNNEQQQQQQQQQQQDEEEERISYAQLSAIIALSIQNFPPSSDSSSVAGGKNNDEAATGTVTKGSVENNNNNNNNTNNNSSSIPQILSKYIIKDIIRYVEKNNLNREIEIKELMDIVEKYSIKRDNKAALKQILPLYVGYFASLITANPLPMIIGAAAMSATQINDNSDNERKNTNAVSKQSNTFANIEQTSLLDEMS